MLSILLDHDGHETVPPSLRMETIMAVKDKS